MRRNRQDVLTVKKAKLNAHHDMCTRYISTITSMISGLKDANKAMDDEISDITAYQDELEAVRLDMISETARNENIIHNLNVLIGAEAN